MLNPLRRLLRRPAAPAPARRSLDAAAGGRRWASDPGMASLNADVAAGGPTVRRRAAHYHRNNPHASRASAMLVSNLVGAGLRPQSETSDVTIRSAIDASWARWADQAADASGRLDFYGMQALALRSVIEGGECVALLRIGDDGGLRVQLLDPRQVDETLQRELGDGRRIVSGVELDDAARAVAFHVLPAPPGDPWRATTHAVRIEAGDVIHAFEPLAPGQVRGLPWLTPVLLRLHDLDGFEDAALVRQKVAACFAGFITSLDGQPPFEGTPEGSTLTGGLEPGTMKVLPPGTDIRFSDPAQTDGGYEPFVAQQLRAIAAGVGLTFEQLTGDMRGVNYSSARVALIEFRRRAEQLQQQLVVHQFCRPIWQRWCELEVLAGRLPAEALGSPVRWVPPAWDWVDPLKDAQAEQLAVAAGFKSRSEVIRERGRDPDAVLAEIAAEREAAAAAGLAFDGGQE